jgi:ABC-type nickel/cobalt efflux system permease component RcnA
LERSTFVVDRNSRSKETFEICGVESVRYRSAWFVGALVAWAGALIAYAPASAHPLGNFTINHLVKVDARTSEMHVRYVLDMAEIPTFQTMRARTESGSMDAAQLRAWAHDEIGAIEPSLDVEADGRRLALSPADPHVSTRPGAGGLPTLYWVEDFNSRLATRPQHITVSDESFPDRIGWKDIVVAPATEPTDELRHYPSALLGSPRELTSVAIDFAGGIERVTAVASTRAQAQSSNQPSQVRSNALSDMLARGTSNPWFVILTLLAAIGLGALHALEPGHGKTLLAVSLVGARATPKQALLLATGLTVAHTAGVLLLGVALLVAARWIVPETVYPWVTFGSGLIVAALGASSLARLVRARRGSAHEHGHANSDDHGHNHPHDHAHSLGVEGDAPLSFRGVMLAAMSGNIAPCPAALVVMLAALTLHEIGYGVAVVVAFSIGLAAVLTGLGIALVRGATWLSKRPLFDSAAAFAPLVSACVIAIIGAVMLGQSASAGLIEASPVMVTLLALAGIAAVALAPGHSHVHGHSHAQRQGATS